MCSAINRYLFCYLIVIDRQTGPLWHWEYFLCTLSIFRINHHISFSSTVNFSHEPISFTFLLFLCVSIKQFFYILYSCVNFFSPFFFSGRAYILSIWKPSARETFGQKRDELGIDKLGHCIQINFVHYICHLLLLV